MGPLLAAAAPRCRLPREQQRDFPHMHRPCTPHHPRPPRAARGRDRGSSRLYRAPLAGAPPPRPGDPDVALVLMLLLFNTTRTTSGPPSTGAAIAMDGAAVAAQHNAHHLRMSRCCCCCCSTQRAQPPDPQARGPLSLWTEAWPTQPAITQAVAAAAQHNAHNLRSPKHGGLYHYPYGTLDGKTVRRSHHEESKSRDRRHGGAGTLTIRDIRFHIQLWKDPDQTQQGTS